ncbi:MAG: AbrB/MazE/SpoVT family DNA-binding domain-containing protein [Chloroflexi bacterium]|nr:AbrB/MazE/SpoVT family DNA-binding domain-containing protein [Chloroflexota bacterium]
MTITVKQSNQNAIFIPAELMSALNLHEGDQVQAIVEGKILRLARINKFLELRGALKHDAIFDAAMEQIDQAWQTWTAPRSV